MKNLNEELAELVSQGDIAWLTEMRETMEEVREDIFLIIEGKQDKGVDVSKDRKKLKTVETNIAIVKRSINSLLATQWK